MWLSDAECPLIEDVGIGIGCLKVKGHSEFSVPLCPAVLPLKSDKDPIRTWWQPHGLSPVDPPVDPDPKIELEKREWFADALTTVYQRDGRRIEQQLGVFNYGATAQLNLTTSGEFSLHGASQGPCKLFILKDGLRIVETGLLLRPLEYDIQFVPTPDQIYVGDSERSGEEVRITSEKGKWRFYWNSISELTLTVSVIQDGVATRYSLAPLEVLTVGRQRAESWNLYFQEMVPKVSTPDIRINRLCDYLHYVYRSNIMRLGGIIPHPFSMPKQTFYGFWMWDSCYSAISARWNSDRSLVWGNLLNIENVQYPMDDVAAGCVNNSCHSFGMKYFISDDPMSGRNVAMPHLVPTEHGDGSHPPVFAQALDALWSVDGDQRKMQRLLPNALAYNEWFEKRRASESVPGLILARRWSDSGMDNSKRWGHQGSGIYDTSLEESWWSMPIVTVDINVMSILEMQSLARMCEATGDSNLADQLLRRAKARSNLVLEAFWNQKEGYFFDLDEKSGRMIPVWSPTGIFPLLVNGISLEQIDSLIGHLFDEKKFWAKAPIPSLAMDDPDFRSSHSYWMGCTWMSYTIYILRGLFRLRPQAAWKLLNRILDMLCPEGTPRIFENYNPVTGEGQDCANFSWHGMLIDVIISEMLGLQTGPDLSAAGCACPDEWKEWSIENLHFKGDTYSIQAIREKGSWHTSFTV